MSYSNLVLKPGVLLTGRNAGEWYVRTLNGIVDSQPKFGYHAVYVDFDPINACLPHNMEAAAQLLEPYFRAMEKRQRPYILANITLHEAVKHFSFSPYYFISIEAILRNEVQSIRGVVAVLGTEYTMNHKYLPSLLPLVEIVTLPEMIQNKVDRLRQLYFKTSNVIMADEVIIELNQLDIDLYILACTELALAFDDSEIELKTINLPRLQCQCLLHSTWINDSK